MKMELWRKSLLTHFRRISLSCQWRSIYNLGVLSLLPTDELSKHPECFMNQVILHRAGQNNLSTTSRILEGDFTLLHAKSRKHRPELCNLNSRAWGHTSEAPSIDIIPVHQVQDKCFLDECIWERKDRNGHILMVV